ncbi:MAG: 4-hydroxy-tetrahydrodipicolinate reductase [Spirochaetaceae bacterium]|jgi:4-hydroxy-tetrahydrodipicolinate reductase|nr:4-hydroxy-tetrahydrodipicolinate reductase [Spirochaetaceae bacterium]
MNIALIGYGRMGKLLELRAIERGHRIVCIVEPYAAETESAFGSVMRKSIAELPEADAAVEFTRPDTAVPNILALAERNIPAVVGTTGWHDRLAEVTSAVNRFGASLLWAANFSIGVHLFYRIAEYAAKLIDPFPEYDVGGWEAHHNRKADSPSGTAKTLVERVLAEMTRKRTPVWETLQRPPGPEELHYASLRTGSAPGTHTLIFDSPADAIEIAHTARNREGLAAGALTAAEWLLRCAPGKPAGKARTGVFTLDDVLAGL